MFKKTKRRPAKGRLFAFFTRYFACFRKPRQIIFVMFEVECILPSISKKMFFLKQNLSLK
jgi:hypothetical protein